MLNSLKFHVYMATSVVKIFPINFVPILPSAVKEYADVFEFLVDDFLFYIQLTESMYLQNLPMPSGIPLNTHPPSIHNLIY